MKRFKRLKKWWEYKKFEYQYVKFLKKPQKAIRIVDTSKEPTEDDIKKYYQMYVRKFDRDSLSEWTTKSAITYKKFEEYVKYYIKDFNIYAGWQYMMSMKSDVTIGIGPDAQYVSFYE